MTQDQLRILTILSLLLLSFAILELTTIACITVAIYFTYKYISIIILKHTERGLIQLLPQNIQNHLLNRSIFDILCDFWFYESFRFIKLLFRPLLEPIEPDHAIDALQDINPETKQKYLAKGVVRIMPKYFQKILLGKQRMKQVLSLQDDKNMLLSLKDRQEEPTQDQSEDQLIKIIKIRSASDCEGSGRLEEEESRWSNHKQMEGRAKRAKRDKLISYRKPHKKNIIQIIQNSINMVKRILEIQNVNGHIQNMNTGTIVKVMIVFWLVLLAQIKFNQNARRIVIKTLYVLGGIISVFGTVGTTGVLIYKQWKAKDNSRLLQIEHE